jgi:penicillin-binding protein-related factor A (putative recombinase)
MNQELLTEIAKQTGGSFFVNVFKSHQERYALQLLSEIYQVFSKQQLDGYAIDFWDDIVQHFQLDNTEIEKLLKRNG